MKPKTKPRFLKGKYTDPDNWLVHAAFEALCEYVDCGDMDIVCWYDTDDDIDEHTTQKHVKEHRQAKNAIMELYVYWMRVNADDYEKRNDPINEKGVPKAKMKFKKIKDSKMSRLIFKYGKGTKKEEKKYKKALKAHAEWEAECYKKEEEMLIKLIKIRHYLWA